MMVVIGVGVGAGVESTVLWKWCGSVMLGGRGEQ